MNTVISVGLAGVILALGANHASANNIPHHDSQLEVWAKQRVAEKMGDLRAAYQPSDVILFISEETVRRGPVPLNQLPTDAERDTYAAFGITAKTGFNFPARLELVAQPVGVSAAYAPYRGAFLLVSN